MGEQPAYDQERELVVVVGLGGNLDILDTLLSVPCDGLGPDLSVLDVALVADEHVWDLLADLPHVAIPVLYVVVRHAGGDVEEEETRLSTDIVGVSQASELLLACCVVDLKVHLALGREERKQTNLNPDGRDVLALELTRLVALDKGSLPRAAVADHYKLECWHLSHN